MQISNSGGLPGLRGALERVGITAPKLARILDVNQSTVYNWTSGRFACSVEQLRRLAEILGVTTDELLGLKQ